MADPSDVSLKEFLLDKMEGQDKAVRAALAATEKATADALAATNRYAAAKDAEVDRWRAVQNEWRGSLEDQRGIFVNVGVFNAEMAAIKKELEEGKADRERQRGRQQLIGWVAGAVGMLAALVTVVAVFVK